MYNEIDSKEFEPLQLNAENFRTVSLGLLRSILNPEMRNFFCCVCFQPTSETLYNIETELATVTSCFTSVAVLKDVVKSFIADYVADAEYQSVCSTCSTSLVQMYMLISTRKINLRVIQKFMAQLSECIDNKVIEEEAKIMTSTNIHFHDLIPKLKQHKKTTKEKGSPKNTPSNINQTIAGTNNLQCDECGMTYDLESKLRRHKQNHVLKDCYVCLKTLRGLSNFRNHMLGHKGTKKKRKLPLKFKCEQCSYSSISRLALEGHLNRVHLKIRPYVCDVCKASFFCKGNLQEHLKTHNPKSLMCEMCGLKSNNKKILERHMWTHTDAKGYLCELCNKKFPSKGRLNEHFNLKHSNTKRSCEFCLKSFSCRTTLSRHLNYAHKINKKHAFEHDNSRSATVT